MAVVLYTRDCLNYLLCEAYAKRKIFSVGGSITPMIIARHLAQEVKNGQTFCFMLLDMRDTHLIHTRFFLFINIVSLSLYFKKSIKIPKAMMLMSCRLFPPSFLLPPSSFLLGGKVCIPPRLYRGVCANRIQPKNRLQNGFLLRTPNE